MKYFIDSEFLEDGNTIMPISLAMVCETGEELEIEFQFDKHRVLNFPDPFVKDKVLPHLKQRPGDRLNIIQAREEVELFLKRTGCQPMAIMRKSAERPEFWAHFADYDWVLFCRLWGRMIDLPNWFPKYCMDTQQWFKQLGEPEGVRPPQPENAHCALDDARWVRTFHTCLAMAEKAKIGALLTRYANHKLNPEMA